MSSIAYICSPYGGKDENIEKARKYMRFIAAHGYVPVAPHVMLHGVMDDHDAKQRSAAMSANLRLIDACDVMCVFSDKLTPGMQAEVSYASRTQKPVLRFRLND